MCYNINNKENMKPLKKRISLIVAITIVLVLFFGYFPAKAQEDNFNGHIKVEVSADGVTWINYGGTENPGGAALAAGPGDTVFARVKIWNSGTTQAVNLTGSGSLTNSAYFSVTAVNLDSDNDGTSYDGSFFSGAGTGSLAVLEANINNEADAQMLTATLKLSDSFPVGATNITGQVTIDNYAFIASLPFSFVSSALAAGRNRVSSFRVGVTVAETAAPAANNSSSTSTTTEATTTELPSTGCDCLSI